MKMRSKRKSVLRYLPGKNCKHCELCDGAMGGVRGNNVIIEGRRVCDYCHACVGPYIAHLDPVETPIQDQLKGEGPFPKSDMQGELGQMGSVRYVVCHDPIA